MWWIDPRLIPASTGEEPKDVPLNLWGPKLRLHNALEVKEEQIVFDIEDPKLGKLKRVITYTGSVENYMDLSDFPFDMDDLELIFRTSSDYATLDQKRSGAKSRGQVYCLRWNKDSRNLDPVKPWVNESRLRMRWNCSVHEWTLLGASTVIVPPEDGQIGYRPTTVKLVFHLSRAWQYYFWKAILPLALTVGLSTSAFYFPIDEFDPRMNITIAAFLSAVSLLFVISTFLPKLNNLTVIDLVIVFTMVAIAFVGFIQMLIEWLVLHEDDAKTAWAETINTWSFYAILVVYLVFCLAVIFPPFRRKRESLATYLDKYTSPTTGKPDDLTFLTWLEPSVINLWEREEDGMKAHVQHMQEEAKKRREENEKSTLKKLKQPQSNTDVDKHDEAEKIKMKFESTMKKLKQPQFNTDFKEAEKINQARMEIIKWKKAREERRTPQRDDAAAPLLL
mmetsp:Transcript_15283/g.46652  ORF Transcript_15283/g.46652 Transcript_15283/m.46652 type:complete len:449 (-) Transcript_15283:228-1574(-)